MTDYMEWKKRMADKTAEKVLKTIDHVLDDADSRLTMVELDELKDCWKLLCKVSEALK